MDNSTKMGHKNKNKKTSSPASAAGESQPAKHGTGENSRASSPVTKPDEIVSSHAGSPALSSSEPVPHGAAQSLRTDTDQDEHSNESAPVVKTPGDATVDTPSGTSSDAKDLENEVSGGRTRSEIEGGEPRVEESLEISAPQDESAVEKAPEQVRLFFAILPTRNVLNRPRSTRGPTPTSTPMSTPCTSRNSNSAYESLISGCKSPRNFGRNSRGRTRRSGRNGPSPCTSTSAR